MKILIIEDDIFLAETLKRILSENYYSVDVCCDGKSGSWAARTNKYNVILLDLILPEKSGVLVCKEIRQSGIKCPVLVMSSQSEILDKITMFEIGIDDYVVKPFEIEEIIARIKALVRRPYEVTEKIIILEDLTIDINAQTVLKDGKEIYLTRKEYMLLRCLAMNEGRIIPRGKILEEVWDSDSNPFTNTIETHVRNLRKKIESDGKKIIHSINGRGYRIGQY